ncbi:class I SAM-dependent methyltransferase [Pseudoalteromonas xiamenensis]
MPTFKGDEATNYDSRIQRLIPGYELLHDLTLAQLHTLFPESARILVVGAGTGFEVVKLAMHNPKWHLVAQDVSEDMLEIAKSRCLEAGIQDRVSFLAEPLAHGKKEYDAVVCLLVLHFLPDDGEKSHLLRAIQSHLQVGKPLFLADLMKPHTPFEREAQLFACENLGLTSIGVERMRHNLTHEFFPLDRMRLADLLDECRFDSAKPYFQALGFVAVTSFALP